MIWHDLRQRLRLRGGRRRRHGRGHRAGAAARPVLERGRPRLALRTSPPPPMCAHPISQGITQSLSVFIDTIVICSCTAFIILLGDVYVPGAEGIDGVVLTQQSLVSHLGALGAILPDRRDPAVCLLLDHLQLLSRRERADRDDRDHAMSRHVLRIVVMGMVFLGAVAPGATAVFFFSDPMMGILALVNLIALMMLFPIGLRVLTRFPPAAEGGRGAAGARSRQVRRSGHRPAAWTGRDPNAD